MVCRKRRTLVMLVMVFTSLFVTSCATNKSGSGGMGDNEKTGTYTGAAIGAILVVSLENS